MRKAQYQKAVGGTIYRNRNVLHIGCSSRFWRRRLFIQRVYGNAEVFKQLLQNLQLLSFFRRMFHLLYFPRFSQYSKFIWPKKHPRTAASFSPIRPPPRLDARSPPPSLHYAVRSRPFQSSFARLRRTKPRCALPVGFVPPRSPQPWLRTAQPRSAGGKRSNMLPLCCFLCCQLSR